MTRRLVRGWASPPLVVQILALLIGAMLVAQAVTLLLTLILPPEPPRRYEMSDIAAALRGQRGARPLERRVQAGPPDLGERGWLVSPATTARLARAVGLPADRVAFGFYTELPVAGAIGGMGGGIGGAPPRPQRLPADAHPSGLPPPLPPVAALDRRPADRAWRPATVPLLALAAPVPVEGGQQGAPGGGGRRPTGADGRPSGLPGGGIPGGFPGGPRGDGHGPGGGDGPGGPRGGGHDLSGLGGRDDRLAEPLSAQFDRLRAQLGATPASGTATASQQPLVIQREQADVAGRAGVSGVGGSGQVDTAHALDAGRSIDTGRALDTARSIDTGRVLEAGRSIDGGRSLGGALSRPEQVLAPAPWLAPTGPLSSLGGRTATVPLVRERVPSAPVRIAEAARPAPPRVVPVVAAPTAAAPSRAVPASSGTAPAPVASRREPAAVATTYPAARPLPIARPAARALFGLATSPFIEGDFVAAARLRDGRWAVVSPTAEGFPNAWQRRVLLWFGLSLLAVAPIAWAFARRIVGPLQGFAAAAELLGRDPSAAILPLDGPAEVGRAAHAFNQMQSRLRSFVDDRTAMIGAISHDLRTPLTRLRFRIEDVPEDQHEGLLGEITAMEAMIASVIAYMRDASTPGVRERRDLAELVGDVVEDAALIGGDVRTVKAEPAAVDIDPLGVRRVLDNLLTNAMKYGGGSARVALHVEDACAVADIVDDGPGIPDAELERVFEPFYRSASALASTREGSGLGLAVCRSIARAHGGDVRLFRSAQGFTARVTLPLAYDGERQLAA